MSPPVVILAAGRGSRLGEETAGRPKCLASLAGRSLLDWQRSALDALGVRERHLVLGYAARAIRPRAGEHVVVNDGWERSGPIGSLLRVPQRVLEAGFVLAYGDCPFHPDLLAGLERHPGDLVITADVDWHALWSLRFADVLADAEVLRFDGDRVAAIGARPRAVGDVEAQFTGLLRVSARGFGWIREELEPMAPEESRRLDTTGLLARLLAAGRRLDAVRVAGRWCEVDTVTDLELYRARLADARPWSHDFRSRAA